MTQATSWDTFVFYYCMWHQGECGTLRDMKRTLQKDMTPSEYKEALDAFRANIQARLDAGIRKTLYEIMKEEGSI